MTSVSIPSFSVGPPTVYRVLVTAGGHTIELEKRFSDFLRLADAVQEEMDEPVPVPPPPKQWFHNSSHELCERRRTELEAMLRALVRSDDFCATMAVADFLGLARLRGSATKTGDWVQLSARIADCVSAARLTEAPADRRRICLDAKVLASQLRSEVEQAPRSEQGAGERARRLHKLDEYQRIIGGLERGGQDKAPSAGVAGFRSAGTGLAPRESPRVLGETAETRDHNNAGLMQAQKLRVQDQDEHLEHLRAAIGRQRSLGHAIQDEISYQNEMLDDLNGEVHRVNANLNRARRKASHLG